MKLLAYFTHHFLMFSKIITLSLSFFCCYFFTPLAAQVSSDTLTLFAEATKSKLDCYQDSTDITVTAYGGTAPYLIDWENTETGDAGQVTIDFDWFFVAIDPAKGGLYRLSVTDADSSTTEIPLLISEPEPITFQLEASQTSCPESQDAVANIQNLAGGTVMIDYQITWLTLPTQHERVAHNLGTGLQTVIISDDKNCSTLDTIRIASLPEMQLEGSLEHLTCPEEKNGKIQLHLQGGTAPYTYEWSQNTNYSENKNLENLAGGWYKLTITDASDICQITDSFFIEEPLPFELDWSIDGPTCLDEVGQINIAAVQNALPPVYFSMNNLGFHDVTRFENLAPGDYTLYLRDANGCRSKENFRMPHNEHIDLNLGGDALLILGDSVRMDFDQSDVFTEFSWQPAAGLSCTDCPNPMAEPLETTTYSLVATDSTGCVQVDEKTVLIQKNRSVYIPSAFSPGNSPNDFFVVFGGQDVKFLRTLRIFNRWGSLMFEVKGDLKPNIPDFGWNGQFKGEPMPAGVYLYEVEVEFLDGELLPYTGDVYLMR